MTHEELLAKIQSDYEENKHFRDEPKWKAFAALRAVVELHRPEGKNVQPLTRCVKCMTTYPCAEIQAIEEQLK